ncbi:MAG TPA: endonuclease MutS2 [Spirochaetota bacterium]|nr:endonuclease MutS2 [Spirochaetota bacterium]
METEPSYTFSEQLFKVLEWDSIISRLRAHCATDPGKEYVDNLHPLSIDGVRTQMTKLHQLMELFLKGKAFDLGGLGDILVFLSRSERSGRLTVEELAMVKKSVLAAHRSIEFMKEHEEEIPSLKDEKSHLYPLPDLRDTLIKAIDDQEELNENYFPGLKKIRQSIFSLRKDIEKKLGSMLNSPELAQVLQEKVHSLRNDRYVVLVKASMRNRIRGTVHDTSSTGATLYLEPESIADINNQLVLKRVEYLRELERILQVLTAQVADHAEELRQNQAILSYLDFLSAAARLGARMKASMPVITDTPHVHLIKARHPMLALTQPDDVVPGDISLGDDYNCLIISGVNTGGKTVLLKTIGLLTLMTAYGLLIPASPDSRIGIFSRIYADIGDDQNLSQSLSTFSGQIVIIRDMLKNATDDSLVLIDEIIVGTDPRQGAALAQAVLEAMADTGARVVTTTHYTELKELASRDSRFQNASVAFDVNSLRPTYQVNIGLPGVSYALEIARLYELQNNVLDRSKELLDSRTLSVESLLEQLQQKDQEINETRKHLLMLQKELSSEKDKYSRKIHDLNRKIEEVKAGTGIEFIEELKEYRKRVADRISQLQHGDLQNAGQLQQDLIDMQQRIEGNVAESRKRGLSDSFQSFDGTNAKKGDRLYIQPLETYGTIDEVDNRNNTAKLILGNAITSQHRFEELLIPPHGQGKKDTGKEKKKPSIVYEGAVAEIPVTVQTSYNTVDLRGLRVDEAINKAESLFDKMTRSGIYSAVVIHGHGTGALKKAIREHLGHSSYVRDFRPGQQGEGGDGVTITMLRA